MSDAMEDIMEERSGLTRKQVKLLVEAERRNERILTAEMKDREWIIKLFENVQLARKEEREKIREEIMKDIAEDFKSLDSQQEAYPELRYSEIAHKKFQLSRTKARISEVMCREWECV